MSILSLSLLCTANINEENENLERAKEKYILLFYSLIIFKN